MSKDDAAKPVREVRAEDFAGLQADLVPEMWRSSSSVQSIRHSPSSPTSAATTARLHHNHEVPGTHYSDAAIVSVTGPACNPEEKEKR